MTQQVRRKVRLVALAALLGVGTVVLSNIAVSVVIGRPVLDTNYVTVADLAITTILQSVFAALPMAVLAARGDTRRAMWVTAVLLTGVSWTYYVWQVWRDSLSGFESGANIGLGLIMLTAPFAILLVLKGVSMLEKRTAK